MRFRHFLNAARNFNCAFPFVCWFCNIMTVALVLQLSDAIVTGIVDGTDLKVIVLAPSLILSGTRLSSKVPRSGNHYDIILNT